MPEGETAVRHDLRRIAGLQAQLQLGNNAAVVIGWMNPYSGIVREVRISDGIYIVHVQEIGRASCRERV